MDIFISTPRHHFYFYNIPGQGSENAMVETGGTIRGNGAGVEGEGSQSTI